LLFFCIYSSVYNFQHYDESGTLQRGSSISIICTKFPDDPLQIFALSILAVKKNAFL